MDGMDELIRDLQEREELSFEEARYYLKKAGGDLDRAIYLVYKRKNSWIYKLGRVLKDKLTSLWQYRLVICRANRMFINIPFYIFLLLILTVSMTGMEFLLWLLIMVGLVMLSGSEMSLVRSKADKMTVPVSRYRAAEWQKPAESVPVVNRSAFSAEAVFSEPDGVPDRKEKPAADAAAVSVEPEYAEVVIK